MDRLWHALEARNLDERDATGVRGIEAAALEESARGVFRARLHKMGVQFSLFVTEKAWNKALKLGATFRTSAEFWMNAQLAVDLYVAAERAGRLPSPLTRAG